MKVVNVLLLLLINISSLIAQNHWTHLRGSHLDGRAAAGSYPVFFELSDSQIWKTPLDGLAWSSPVVFGNQVWLTNATPDGSKLSVVCVDFTSGKILFDHVVYKPEEIQQMHATNSYATPTPAIEDDFVYIHYGTYGTACFNTRDFTLVWSRTDLNCQHMQGAASSLLLHRDRLIVHIEGTDVQYIAALDKRSGEMLWKRHRPLDLYKDIAPVYRKAYTTPIVVMVEGVEQLISNGAQLCIAYDVATGEELWQLWYGYDSTVGMPFVYNGIVYFNSGWIFEPDRASYVKLFAVDPRGRGDIAKTHLLWQTETDVPQITTPVVVDDNIYMVHERGTVTCLKAETGEVVWKERLRGMFNASPIYAGGHIYIFDTRGTLYILKPSGTYELVAEYSLGETVKATPAFVSGSLVVRTDKHLLRLHQSSNNP